ncbi:MAG TPA: DUF4157 domain-containing protein [Candidatus Kapabacteria bacterium]|nr:DUF4157 domain-containing protein [Candidatus Kapabacteria bacterium]
MRTHAQKTPAGRPAVQADSAVPDRAQSGRPPAMNTVAGLPGAIGNPLMQRALYPAADSRSGGGTAGGGVPGTGNESGRAVQTPALQLRRACACGGGCPACRAQAAGLDVSQPGDPAELDADRIAGLVLGIPAGDGAAVSPANTGDAVQRSSGMPGAGHRTILRDALPATDSLPSDSPGHVQRAIGSGGEPLDVRTRSFFEPRLGYDLSNVRIRTDAHAAQSARALGARAYALGSNIVFGGGEYAPESDAGRRLLAHELAHVTQSVRSPTIHRRTIFRQPDGTAGDLAAIEFEIQELSQIPLLGPEAAPVMMRLQMLQQERLRLLSHGAAAPPAPTRPKPVAPPAAAPAPPAADTAGSGTQDDVFAALMGTQTRQIDRDDIAQTLHDFSARAQPGLWFAPRLPRPLKPAAIRIPTRIIRMAWCAGRSGRTRPRRPP